MSGSGSVRGDVGSSSKCKACEGKRRMGEGLRVRSWGARWHALAIRGGAGARERQTRDRASPVRGA